MRSRQHRQFGHVNGSELLLSAARPAQIFLQSGLLPMLMRTQGNMRMALSCPGAPRTLYATPTFRHLPPQADSRPIRSVTASDPKHRRVGACDPPSAFLCTEYPSFNILSYVLWNCCTTLHEPGNGSANSDRVMASWPVPYSLS